MAPKLLRRSALAMGLASVSACSLPVRGPAVPRGQTGRATVLGIPNERFFPALGTGPITEEFHSAVARRHRFMNVRAGQMLPELNLLAVSGGGDDGAFGAGLLNGWSAAGTRPEFMLVTGVSTGGLIAPFAFIGPEYDAGLRRVYTESTLADIAIQRSLLNAVFNDGLADTSPLFRTISRELDERMIARIGQGYREGRLLLIGTTDLDAQLPVIWNVGAIAASGHPGAGALIHRIMLASASIPGAFAPVLFDVTVDGVPHQELHVDGGAINQAFLYPVAVTQARRERLARRLPVQPIRAYVIRNARLDANWAATDRRTMSIASRAVETMIASSGFNDVMRIWLNAQRDDVEYRLAYIGSDFTVPYTTAFNPDYMRPLFEYAFNRARSGYDWAPNPPLIE
ncbi:patatin-like phospholipase family protein [Sediminicoccus sp. KRV36]|uniref:patatin-like phospholipase family protein n=1 Tax=Sediminicoccus sp. KRV36 TaxID=3133721 RepID=UPI002010648E|nr:patatin-like phospholipase family protein [Sediminicoccus rosea]UPY34894.1 patatin-like phospholipase family protein [Sediminicoccus rosea]